MSKLIIKEEPLLVLPSLAKSIGLNEAVFLQQIQSLSNESIHFHDGYYWVRSTYEDWHRQCPFWSISTIKRTIKRLELRKFIIVGKYNNYAGDNTKCYRVNLELLTNEVLLKGSECV